MQNELSPLQQYNAAFRKGDEAFHNAVKSFNMSDGAFWILYNLRDIGHELSQREVYRNACMPKQTVNSALKRLQSDGYIEFRAESGTRGRIVALTPKGEELAVHTVDMVMNVERLTMSRMPAQELGMLISLMNKYTNALTNNLRAMLEGMDYQNTLDGE